jgi:hypothetical protein
MRSQWGWRSRVGASCALLALVMVSAPGHAVAQATDCTRYDSQIWAQSV